MFEVIFNPWFAISVGTGAVLYGLWILLFGKRKAEEPRCPFPLGFRVYVDDGYGDRDERNRWLTEEEMKNLYMKHDGSLVRFEPFVRDGEAVAYVRQPRGLIIMPLEK